MVKNYIKGIYYLLLGQKDVMNISELADYTGLSRNYIYRLTSQGKIPFSKPSNKVLFFSREKINAWLLSKPNIPEQENEVESLNYLINKKKGGRRWDQ